MATHYEVLGAAPGATHDELRRAYYRLARRHHPDAHSQSPPSVQASARRTMVAVNAAWAVLGDADRRRAYDAELAPPPPRTPPGRGDRTRGQNLAGLFSLEDEDEVDEEVPAYRLEEDPDTGARDLADIFVLVPVGLALTAVVCFCLALVMEWPALFGLSLLLVPLTLVTFLAMPFVVMATKVRSRPTRD